MLHGQELGTFATGGSKKKLSKLQPECVKGYISDNAQINYLNVQIRTA